ncbi:uncharacterized protein LOC100900457 [Galendromus occidentalis]|uniref:Uncharacterized protein LOC100900457 n=1 Tax=Galendromus occidentalis TaxID=34638 RepID=A0AAJ6QVD7_9ACAR|nr:uncharacterized protein LOC100900457 [Galendromus occidentalis]
MSNIMVLSPALNGPDSSGSSMKITIYRLLLFGSGFRRGAIMTTFLVFSAVALIGECKAALPRADLRHALRFGSQYTVTGLVIMPSLEIEEPFIAYIDESSGKSRVDYYKGEMKTFQIDSEFSRIYWSLNSETHATEVHCHTVSASGLQEPTGVLPDLSDLEFVREEACNTDSNASFLGESGSSPLCLRYERILKDQDRETKLVFWTSRDADAGFIPKRYRVTGYDNFLKSRLDEYEVIYLQFTIGDLDEDVFDIRSVTDKPCIAATTMSELSGYRLLNPMRGFVHNDVSRV